MYQKRTFQISAVALLACLAAACPRGIVGDGVLHCYLTWQGDTSTTITVNYHTAPGNAASMVFYDTVSRGGDPVLYQFQQAGQSHEIPGLHVFAGAQRAVHVSELTGLTPGATYYFVAGDAENGFTEEKMFRTLPDTGSVRLVTGGDMGTGPNVPELLAHAAAVSPHLGLIGGDIAYADGELGQWREWERWLDHWEAEMVTPEGYTIPMILAIGNHETGGSFFQFATPRLAAPFYFGYFAQADRAYFDRQLGPHARLFVLDTAHVTPLTGAQSQWLSEELAATPLDVLTLAVYHVPMYPSHRNFAFPSMSSLVRQAWRPIFDQYGLTAAFENHDHVQKRTKRLRNDAPDPNGTLYVGDGCFGRSPRSGDQAQALANPAVLDMLGLEESYLASWDSRRHFWTVDINADGAAVDFAAIDETGTVFDTYTLVP